MRVETPRIIHTHPRFFTWLLMVVFLGMWGYWAGPHWNPNPSQGTIVPETRDTTIMPGVHTQSVGSFEVLEEEIDIPFADTTLHAIVRKPAGFDGLAPLVVFLHGTGTHEYTDFASEAQEISSAGIITLVSDKPIDNYSLTHRDYHELAQDFSYIFTYGLSIDGVDVQRAGFYAVSEGCLIAPIVASANPQVTFVILASSPVFPIREQGAFAADTYLREIHIPVKALQIIPRLLGQEFGTGIFDYIDFDPQEYHRQMSQPVLMLYGTEDMSMPIVQGALQLREDLADNGNDDLTVRYYENADHGLRVDGKLVSSAMEDVSRWVTLLPQSAHATPRVAGATPVQEYWVGDVGQTRWFASGRMGVISATLPFVFASIALFLALIFSVWAWIQKRDFGKRDMLLITSNTVAIASIVLLLIYVMFVGYIATNYEHNDVMIRGGWILVRIMALYSAWRFTLALFHWCTYARTHSAQFLIFRRLYVCIALVANSSFLFFLAYWGVYPSLF